MSRWVLPFLPFSAETTLLLLLLLSLFRLFCVACANSIPTGCVLVGLPCFCASFSRESGAQELKFLGKRMEEVSDIRALSDAARMFSLQWRRSGVVYFQIYTIHFTRD